MTRRLVVIAASLLALSPAKAQLTPLDSARLRAEIATALLEFNWNYNRPLSFRIGTAGSSIPDSLIPPTFRILGGTGENRLLLESPSAAADAERVVREHLLAKGLRMPELRQRREEGFVFSPATPSPAGYQYRPYCMGTDVLGVTVRPQWSDRGNRSLILFWNSGQYGGSPCSAERDNPELLDDEPTLEMPILRPPPGATSNGGGMSGSGSGGSGSYQRTARAEVRTEMTARDLILFYAAQLAEQGWTVTQPAIVAEAAIMSARKTDKEGRDLQGVLADVKSPSGTHYMTFQIDRASARRRRP